MDAGALLLKYTFLCECAMRVSRVIAVGAKWQAASVRSQVMGLGSGPRATHVPVRTVVRPSVCFQ